jgi:hypothetical protein
MGGCYRLLSHFLELEIIIRGDASDGDDEAREVDRGKDVFENDVGSGDGNHFLENAANTEGDDACSLQKSKLGGGHQER